MSVLNLKDYSMNMRTVQKCRLVILLLALLASAAVMINGCATNAATGKRQFNLISESQEIAIVRDADKQISAQMGLYPNDALQKYVSDLGLKMAASDADEHCADYSTWSRCFDTAGTAIAAIC
ncbi:MAG: hypothetical protein IPH59_10510 [bacterium]|nr:hypothetical protein [bacterium]